jgi:hypothetical protein
MKIESAVSLFSNRRTASEDPKPTVEGRASLDKPIGWFFNSISSEYAGATFRNKKVASKAQSALFIMTEQGPVAYRLPKACSAYEWVHRAQHKVLLVTTPEGRTAYQAKSYRLIRTHDFISGKALAEAEKELEHACASYFHAKPRTRESRVLVRFLMEMARPGEPFALLGTQYPHPPPPNTTKVKLDGGATDSETPPEMLQPVF